jgi:hypothetical protein
MCVREASSEVADCMEGADESWECRDTHGDL